MGMRMFIPTPSVSAYKVLLSITLCRHSMEKPSKLKLFILDLFPPLPSHTAGLLSCTDRCHPKVCSGVWCCPFLEEREFRFANGVSHTEAVLGMPPLALGVFLLLGVADGQHQVLF